MKIVLLVEDDTLIRELYLHEFKKSGLTIEARINGAEALQAIHDKHYDLVLLDIMMPVMNGIEVLKKIRENESTRTLPVILLSNLAQDNIMREAIRLGINGYIVKENLLPAQIVTEMQTILADPTRLNTFMAEKS